MKIFKLNLYIIQTAFKSFNSSQVIFIATVNNIITARIYFNNSRISFSQYPNISRAQSVLLMVCFNKFI